jgi:hypothetical protein
METQAYTHLQTLVSPHAAPRARPKRISAMPPVREALRPRGYLHFWRIAVHSRMTARWAILYLTYPSAISNNGPVVYRSGPENDFRGGGVMQFRLFYQGPLFASQGDAWNGQIDKRANHKHDIRRAFHKQLKHLWSIHPALMEKTGSAEIFGGAAEPQRPLAEVTAEQFDRCGMNWVPLVCEPFGLGCKLDVLFLRRDRPGKVLDARDLDNRLKTLFDALRLPKSAAEIGGFTPDESEKPFFVLLQDDNMISHLSVETDDLLDPPVEAGKDDGYIRAVITVTITLHRATWFAINYL